jgi:hypothetical protein
VNPLAYASTERLRIVKAMADLQKRAAARGVRRLTNPQQHFVRQSLPKDISSYMGLGLPVKEFFLLATYLD